MARGKKGTGKPGKYKKLSDDQKCARCAATDASGRVRCARYVACRKDSNNPKYCWQHKGGKQLGGKK